MYKELIISLIIIIAIIMGNTITQNYTKQTVAELSDSLNELKEKISQDDENINWEEVEIQIEDINKKWNERYDKMAYYIEHNELEKVESNITGLKSYTQKQTDR